MRWSQSGVLGRWSDHKGCTPINGVNALEKVWLPFLPCKDTPVASERNSHQTSDPLCLDAGLPSSQNCEKKMFIVNKPPSLGNFVIAAQTHQDINLVRIMGLQVKEEPLAVIKEGQRTGMGSC